MAGSDGRLKKHHITQEKQQLHIARNGVNGINITMRKKMDTTQLPLGGRTRSRRILPKHSPKTTNKKDGIATWFNPPWSTQPQAKLPKSKTITTSPTKMNLFLVGLSNLDAKFETV